MNQISNDKFILKLINDPDYCLMADRIMTRIATTGKKFTDPNRWRDAGINKGFITYKRKKLSLARVMFAWNAGKIDSKKKVSHKNGNPKDFHPDNLIQLSQQEINLRRFRFFKRPAVWGNKKLTWDIVRQIRKEKKLGATHKYLCEKYNISKGHVSEIVNHKIWIERVFTGAKAVLKINGKVVTFSNDVDFKVDYQPIPSQKLELDET